MTPETEKELHGLKSYPFVAPGPGPMLQTHNSLCGHEQRLDYGIHEASVSQVDQAGFSRLRLPSLPQKT